MHEQIQAYLDNCYSQLQPDIQKSLFAADNEIYGELYYYSVVKLLKYLNVTATTHFLDIGSGLGKIVVQIFLTTAAQTVTGIEINSDRHLIACNIKNMLTKQLPELFNSNRAMMLLNSDFLTTDFANITMAYVCATVFSFPLLQAMGSKLNSMPKLKTIISFRKLPNIANFKLTKKIFLQASWDHTPCYIYTSKILP